MEMHQYWKCFLRLTNITFFIFYKNNVIDGTTLQPGGYEATECLIVFLILKKKRECSIFCNIFQRSEAQCLILQDYGMNMCPVQSSTFHMLDDLVCFVLLLHYADLR